MSFNARAIAAGDAAKARDSNAVYLPCKKCDREVCGDSRLVVLTLTVLMKIASNRYASHFSSCMGAGSSRKAAQKPLARSVVSPEMSNTQLTQLGQTLMLGPLSHLRMAML